MTATTIGILGAGQLGRMLALAGYPLGLRFRFFDPASPSPAGLLAPQVLASYDDEAALARFAEGLDLVGYEFENVPVAAAYRLAARVPVYPPPLALAAAQDRLSEKEFFRRLGLATPPFVAVHSRAALDEAIAAIGLPALLKTRRLGYDGKGQALLRTPADADAAWAALGDAPLILEGFVAFTRELSIIAVRARGGATAFYPLVENQHRDGILRRSIAPAPAAAGLQQVAEDWAGRVLDALGYVGVLAIELFEVGGALLANEMAPRVHNSGHWTIEGAATSQFENHLRAMLDLPLGATSARGGCAMLNLIGDLPGLPAALALPDTHLHLYDKAPRPGRKLGHITLLAPDAASAREQAQRLAARLGI